MVEKESTGLEGLSLFIALRWMQRTRKGDDGAYGKYPSLLEDFQTGTPSMARKRHLASTARGFLCFCLMASHEYTDENPSCGVLPSRQMLLTGLYRGRCPRLLFGSAFQAPERLRSTYAVI